jgi:hypothetical protein
VWYAAEKLWKLYIIRLSRLLWCLPHSIFVISKRLWAIIWQLSNKKSKCYMLLKLLTFESEVHVFFQTILSTKNSTFDMTAWSQLAMYTKYVTQYQVRDRRQNNILCIDFNWSLFVSRKSKRQRNWWVIIWSILLKWGCLKHSVKNLSKILEKQ